MTIGFETAAGLAAAQFHEAGEASSDINNFRARIAETES